MEEIILVDMSSVEEGDAPFDGIEVEKNWKGKGKQKLKQLGFLVDAPGQYSYTLVYTILLGIRLSVGRVSAREARELTREDFEHKVKLKIPRAQLQMSAAMRGYDFKFKDYCPMVFRHIRERFGIDSADYMVSLTSDYKLHEIVAEGKSGSMFFHSVDQRFLIKTTTNSEAKFLSNILPHYYQHVMKHPHTLITRIFGLHRVKPYKPHKKTHFIVMGNINVPNRRIHEKFDLKGSTIGRRTNAELRKKGGCLKDLDFLEMNKKIYLGPNKSALFIKQLQIDTEFLQHMKIMDYSLLLCVHKRSEREPPKLVRRATLSLRDNVDLLQERERERAIGSGSIKVREILKSRQTKKTFEDGKNLHVDFTVERFNMVPSERMASVFQRDEGGFMSTNANDEPLSDIYFFGIIDILQKYNMRKNFEHGIKTLKYRHGGISAVSPSVYGERFFSFLEKLIDNKSLEERYSTGDTRGKSSESELKAAIMQYQMEMEKEKEEIVAGNMEEPRATFKTKQRDVEIIDHNNWDDGSPSEGSNGQSSESVSTETGSDSDSRLLSLQESGSDGDDGSGNSSNDYSDSSDGEIESEGDG